MSQKSCLEKKYQAVKSGRNYTLSLSEITLLSLRVKKKYQLATSQQKVQLCHKVTFYDIKVIKVCLSVNDSTKSEYINYSRHVDRDMRIYEVKSVKV